MTKKNVTTNKKRDPQDCSHGMWNKQDQPDGSITCTCFLCEFAYQITAEEVKSLSALDVEKLMKKRADEARWTMAQVMQAIRNACEEDNEPEATRLAQIFNQRFTSVIVCVQRDPDNTLSCIPIETSQK